VPAKYAANAAVSCGIAVNCESRTSVVRENLLSLGLRCLIQLLLLIAAVLSGVILLARLGGMTLAMQYGQSALNGNATFYFVVDVQRGLRLRQDQPLDTTLSANRETASDGRRVVSAQRGGNIDLFVVGSNGAWQPLTHFSDFSPARTERDSRRANLYPAWSPDGQWIAFVSADVNGRLDLYAVRPGSVDLRQLGEHIRVVTPFPPRWIVIPATFPGDFLGSAVIALCGWWIISRFFSTPAASSRA
jgi:hypothetical protein